MELAKMLCLGSFYGGTHPPRNTDSHIWLPSSFNNSAYVDRFSSLALASVPVSKLCTATSLEAQCIRCIADMETCGFH